MGVVFISEVKDGNIAGKSDIGPYHYDLAQPHALSKVDNAYGAINTGSQTITYNGFNKVETINTTLNTGLNTLLLTYGPDQQRWKTQQFRNGALMRQTILAGDYEAETEGSVTRQLYYIYGGEGLAAIYVKETNKVDNIYYTITDHLGSVLKLVDGNGTEVFAATYDAWGRRYVTNGILPLRRGYGGHEHLDEFSLINMDGRLYDPTVGRFLSPDPYVQMPESSQSVNRYSYCLNNPLKYTDPTGELFVIDDFILASVLFAGVSNWIMSGAEFSWKGLGTFAVGAGAAAAGNAAGMAMGALVGAGSGFFNGAAMGAASGFAGGFVGGIGNSLLNGNGLGSSLASGLTGGLMGGVTPGLIGGVMSGFDAMDHDANFFTAEHTINMRDLAGGGEVAYGGDLDFIERVKTFLGVKTTYAGPFEDVGGYEARIMGKVNADGSGSSAGITLPPKRIIVGKGAYRQAGFLDLLQHEYGHILQYRMVGSDAYWGVIAPESFKDAMIPNIFGHSHKSYWTETWANHLSNNYFGNASKLIKNSSFPIGNISHAQLDWLKGIHFK